MMAYLYKPRVIKANQGFSLVEVLMAAVVMMGLLVGTNRVVMQGMAASGRAGLRSSLEQEILNDVESIQAIDTMFNTEPFLTAACNQGRNNSSEYLAAQITKQLEVPETKEWQRELNSTDSDLLVVTYSFSIPGRQVSNEKRAIELNPSFATSCPLLP